MNQRRLVVVVTIISLVLILCLLLVSKSNSDDVYSHIETLRSKTVGDLTETISGLKQSAGDITAVIPKNICEEEKLEVLVDTSKAFHTTHLSTAKNPKYKDGKEIIYEDLYKCRPPQYLPGYRSPCWLPKSGAQQVCMARVVLLGFHKCGTSDLAKWFYNTKFSSTTVDYFWGEIGATCPAECIEKAGIQHHGLQRVTANVTVYGGCPGCSLINKALRTDAHTILVHSSIQYVKHLQTDQTRYIITMRNPTQRVLSHYFYLFKTKAVDPESFGWQGKTSTEDIGNQFLHEQVIKALKNIEECLLEKGINECIVTRYRKRNAVASLIIESCYAPYIRQVLKFIPKELIYFSMMEDYAARPEEVVPAIFSFIGESLNGEDIAVLSSKKLNSGVKSKPVLPETIKLLDDFFVPFNEELATVLEDNKWKFLPS